jgi:predicted metal-dependent HD superfamily phosphohydrolase
MQPDNPFIQQTSEYAQTLLKERLPGDLVYHNFDHTAEVVEASRKIGRRSGLSDSELEIVTIAAWLHDVGYSRVYRGHEEEGVTIATEFLRGIGYPEERIDRVAGCIMATKMPQNPRSLIEEVLCDADLSHLAKKNSIEKGERLRREWAKCLDTVYSDPEWVKYNIGFLKSHRYHTLYAQSEYEPGRIENLAKLKRRYRRLTEGTPTAGERPTPPVQSKAARKEANPERGVETMFRLTSHNHIELSKIADQKANLMISANALIISVIVSLLGSRMEEDPYLILPTLLLLASCLAAIVFATLSTRPTITSGTFTQEDIREKRVNLLFFGNFFNMPLEDYEHGMRQMMGDSEYLYGSLTKDIYFLGRVLGRKYRLLRLCYNVFMYGLIASVVAYAIAFSVSR